MDKKNKIIIYTDGSSFGNPGPGGWGALVVYPDDRAVEIGGSEKHTTNNRMELTAVIEALREVGERRENIIFYTDSAYVINGITKWIEGWVTNGWIKRDKMSVLNRDLWEKLLLLTADRMIAWKHVSGHAGMAGNERADEIATAFAEGKQAKLYRGSYSDYHVDVEDFSYDERKRSARVATRARRKKKAYSYLSLIDGKFMRHKTWAECEACVKGKKGVQYKKALSAEDEKAIQVSWGV